MKDRYIDYVIETYDDKKRKMVQKLVDNPDDMGIKLELFDSIGEGELKKKSNFNEEVCSVIGRHTTDCNLNNRELWADIYASNILYGCSIEEFFQYEFKKKNDVGRSEYLTDQERFVLFRHCYDFAQYEKIRNKWFQYNEIGEFWGRECILCDKSTCTEPGFYIYERFVEKNPVYIYKPIRDCCGNGVVKVDTKGKDLKKLYDEHCNYVGGGIIDECISQESSFSAFHPNSVNAVRLIALRTKHKTTHFWDPMLRIGVGNEIIDNGSASIRAMGDIGSGIIYTKGRDGYGNEYMVHPDTGKTIVGFSIPEYKEMTLVADKVMNKIEQYARFVGFDMAYTNNGWTIIEINPFPQFYMQQMLVSRGQKKELLALLN